MLAARRLVSSISVDPFTVVQGLIADHNKFTETPDTGLRLLSSKPLSPKEKNTNRIPPGWRETMAAEDNGKAKPAL